MDMIYNIPPTIKDKLIIWEILQGKYVLAIHAYNYTQVGWRKLWSLVFREDIDKNTRLSCTLPITWGQCYFVRASNPRESTLEAEPVAIFEL